MIILKSEFTTLQLSFSRFLKLFQALTGAKAIESIWKYNILRPDSVNPSFAPTIVFQISPLDSFTNIFLSSSIPLGLFFSLFKLSLLFFIHLSSSIMWGFSPKHLKFFRSSSHYISLICQSRLTADNRHFLKYLLYFLKNVSLFFIYVSQFLFLFYPQP